MIYVCDVFCDEFVNSIVIYLMINVCDVFCDESVNSISAFSFKCSAFD